MTFAELLAYFSANISYDKYKDYEITLINEDDEPYLQSEVEIDEEDKIIIIT
jgi:hypothetical protein